MLRLRQVCLVAPNLEPAVSDLAAILGLSICVRDFHVDIYGLTNALLPIGDDFIEIVAPLRGGTAAGRFIERSGGRGAYMAIFECEDPERRQAHVEAMGIRTPHIIDRAEYRNVQLHPKDCGAAILEFARSSDKPDGTGTWWPAGPDWRSIAPQAGRAELTGLDVSSSDPEQLASRWAGILELPLTRDGGAPTLAVDGRRLAFIAGAADRVETLVVSSGDPARTLQVAARRGRQVTNDRFHLGGVDFRVTAVGS
jgi:hypothetical protein